MNSIHKAVNRIKRKMAYIPFDFFVAVLICLVGFASFALGWIAHSQYDPHNVSIESIPVLETTAGELFVGSRNSDKFHYRWCAGAAQITGENRIYFADKQEAIQSGYKPAKNCPGL
jgi:hypothetical protein